MVAHEHRRVELDDDNSELDSSGYWIRRIPYRWLWFEHQHWRVELDDDCELDSRGYRIRGLPYGYIWFEHHQQQQQS